MAEEAEDLSAMNGVLKTISGGHGVGWVARAAELAGATEAAGFIAGRAWCKLGCAWDREELL